MDILCDETVLALMRVDWSNGEVAVEARREAERRGLLEDAPRRQALRA